MPSRTAAGAEAGTSTPTARPRTRKVASKAPRPSAAPKAKRTVKRVSKAQAAPSKALSRATAPTLPSFLQAGPTPAPYRSSGHYARYWWGLTWLGGGLLLILLGSATAAYLTNGSTSRSLEPLPPEPQPAVQAVAQTLVAAPFTGLLVTPDAAARRPWVVVVENFPTARPQYGLSAADMVLESPTEGGITRFLAVFQSRLPDGRVGPVRSARSFFNDWVRGLAGIFSHSGGSVKALKQLAERYGGIQDANEFAYGAAYERDSTREAPHNLFTTAARFMNYASARGWKLTAEVPALAFAPAATANGTAATTVELPYSPREYRVRYDYRPSEGTYFRSEDGTTLTDAATGKPIAVTNVVALYTDITPVPNDALKRVDMRTLGSGTAILYTKGSVYRGTWQKRNLDSPIAFTGQAGEPLPLQPGNTWISVLDSSLIPPASTTSPSLVP